MRARSLPRAALLVGLLVTLTTGGALLACGSFSEDPGDGGLAEAGPEAGLEAAVLPDGAPIPPCDVAKVDSDPAHCGRCGHSCLGGACTARACQPALMATFSARSVEGPVVDATHVVVATRADPLQRVQWCPKEGCPGGLVVAADLPTAPTSLASDGTDELVSTLGGKSAGVFRV